MRILFVHHPPQKSFVVALDGPAASGKGTLARRISDHYTFAYLDTGMLYRGVALQLLNSGFDPKDGEKAAASAQNLDLKCMSDPRLRSREVGAAASVVAANAAVRAALLDFQRQFAGAPPGGIVRRRWF